MCSGALVYVTKHAGAKIFFSFLGLSIHFGTGTLVLWVWCTVTMKKIWGTQSHIAAWFEQTKRGVQTSCTSWNSWFHWVTAILCPLPTQSHKCPVYQHFTGHQPDMHNNALDHRIGWKGKTESKDRKTDLQRVKFFRMKVIPVASLQRELTQGLGVSWAGSSWAGHETPFGCIGNGNRWPTALLLQHCFCYMVKTQRVSIYFKSYYLSRILISVIHFLKNKVFGMHVLSKQQQNTS